MPGGQVVHFSPDSDWIRVAYLTLAPLLGTAAASTLFAVALLASGQSSTITGTLAGQVVMEGFMHWRIKPWVRRLITRTLAILPAVLIIGIRGDSSVTDLLTLSQVVLALQLPFAMFPLLHFTSSRKRMGKWRNGWFLLIAGWAQRDPDHRDGHLRLARFAENRLACDRRRMTPHLEMGYTTMYDTILVTLDGTPTDRAIIEHVKQLAKLRTAAWCCCTSPMAGPRAPTAPMPSAPRSPRTPPISKKCAPNFGPLAYPLEAETRLRRSGDRDRQVGANRRAATWSP